MKVRKQKHLKLKSSSILKGFSAYKILQWNLTKRLFKLKKKRRVPYPVTVTVHTISVDRTIFESVFK